MHGRRELHRKVTLKTYKANWKLNAQLARVFAVVLFDPASGGEGGARFGHFGCWCLDGQMRRLAYLEGIPNYRLLCKVDGLNKTDELNSPLPDLPTNLRSLNLATWFFMTAVQLRSSEQ